ncbi:AsnC family transcriptional regulator [Pyrococcus furiosus DSM 3638]|uniref:AsnC family transcriptional regulator n=3 Tax=Pyrococcus furiosus TaxID=2261 RepID=A0A5C0XSW2_PYRFU|nr:Lrp/AsnC ligand binding domain-containing protein [Pyrococcus furiosus]AAL81856.1 transcriptional regulatory protein, asnC family [Pyrococcus furiosus DSM 3638]AFN04910.1 AsnC family transcriptional regulator [Pyrococcus furiosus COM1]QEK79348.1 AsnC family transcriptional regulator [Pyrococcus furiosus DSM 3638]
MEAFILVITYPGKEKEVYEALKARPEVKEIYRVYGDYDIVARVEVKDLKDLDRFHDEVLRKITGVEVSETLITSSYQ